MALPETLQKIKNDLRISHTALDTDISDNIDACLADLRICGVNEPDENDAAILAALKLYCRAAFTDDTAQAAAYILRYGALKGTLMMASGYGGDPDE